MFDSREAAWRAMVAIDLLTRAGATKIDIRQDGTARFNLMGARGKLDRNLNLVPVEKPRYVLVEEAKIKTTPELFAERGDMWNARNQQTSAYRPLGEHPKTNAFGDLCNKPTIEGYEGWDEPVYVKPKERPVLKLKLDPGPRKLCQARQAYREGR